MDKKDLEGRMEDAEDAAAASEKRLTKAEIRVKTLEKRVSILEEYDEAEKVRLGEQ